MRKPKPTPQSFQALIGDTANRMQLAEKLSSVPNVTPISAKQLAPGTAEVVNKLFRELMSIFPAWRQAWPDDDALAAAKRTWIKAFVVAEINRLEQIRFGIERCRALGTDFMPSVGKFIKLCQPTPEMLGIPSHERALREALDNLHPSRAGNRAWSHPAVRHAALQCEIDNLSEITSEQATEIFGRAYDITIRALMAGEPLEDIAIGIGHDSQKGELQRSMEYTEWRLNQTMIRQAIPPTAAACRAHLLVKLNIKRAGHPVGEGV